jgi:hypothetical protein
VEIDMHDLNTIVRLNVEAHGKAITQWRADGKFVVAIYEGITLHAATPYGDEETARIAARADEQRNTGRRVEVLLPTGSFHAATRDQSEDRGVSYATVEEAVAATTQHLGEVRTLTEAEKRGMDAANRGRHLLYASESRAARRQRNSY